MRPVRFQIENPLPVGTTVLEASAGTGKTWTIAALAARYVAEGVAELPELMLVTFGRDATQELRERVRERLVSAERALADPDAARAGADQVHALLARAPDADDPDAEVARRRARLGVALARFDAATIATTHQFCRRMLDALGVAGDADPDAVFTESIDDLLAEVVDDFYVRKYAAPGADPPPFSRAVAGELARAAVYDPQARLEPTDAEPGSPAAVRWAFTTAVRAEVERRKWACRLHTYDDLLTRLRDALADPARAAAQRLRERYRVVLVDEFQDTDPIQWDILRRAFHGHTTLVLIGDPKQAIYAFRGADVHSYLDAAAAADTHATLAQNHRSDAGLLRALHTVYGDAALGHPRIVAHPVEAVHHDGRLAGAPVDTALRLRVLRRDGLPTAPSRPLAVVGPARARVAEDLAADIGALLASRARLGGDWGERAVEPGDVAVLVRTNDQGTLVGEALQAAGIPAVVSGTASVFGTPAAHDWLVLLDAVERPRAAQIRAVALTAFCGHPAAELCGPDADPVVDRTGAAVRAWTGVLHAHGVAALLEAVTAGTGATGTGLPARLLATTGGERLLTDLRHVGEALHAAAVDGHLGPAALHEWLRHRIADARTDTVRERSRRLESDAAAVQIVTVHRSKGLEFPVVYLPFGWDRNVRDPEVPLLHDDAGARVLDVGGPDGDGHAERLRRHRAEEAGEDLRLLYVALTRACCQVVAWWVPATTTAGSPLHRLLFGRPAPGTEVRTSLAVPTDVAAAVALRALAGPDLAVEEVGARAPTRYRAAAAAQAALGVGTLDRVPDDAWRRTSYSALTADAHRDPSSGPVSEPESVGTVDELAVSVDAAPAVAPVRSPMADLPVGAAFGTLVHAVLETADLGAADLLGELTAHAAEHLARRPVAGVEPDLLAAALRPAVQTPLGPLAGGLRLCDVSPRDRLAELDFELPLAGGDRPRPGAATLGPLAELLARHLPAGHPLAGYPALLAGLAGPPLRGYLTGSIDAVLRLPDGTYAVVDHKTNWLGPIGDGLTGDPPPLTAAHYAPARLAQAMVAAHYPLQALLYAVALHRFLRWRLAGYRPDTHLGGAFYLFLRGMCGPATPLVDGAPCGVFAWRPPAELVVGASELLEARR